MQQPNGKSGRLTAARLCLNNDILPLQNGRYSFAPAPRSYGRTPALTGRRAEPDSGEAMKRAMRS